MRQLLQTLKDGDMEIVELPRPIPGDGDVLVQTFYSAISTGTEGKTVSDARKGYIAKANARKEEVRKVIKLAKSQGIAATYKMVINKLEALQPLGYSLSGRVIEVGGGVQGFKPGDLVACGGVSASHSEMNVVPENLCVKLGDSTPLDQAAFTTIGAIAVQGIRRAELSFGESCAVIGLGLLGQITLRLLEAAGIRAYGIDIKPQLVDLARQAGFEANTRTDETIVSAINQFSNGFGVDAVIITAASSSIDPVDFAGEITRQRGKVVVVGNVPTGFARKLYYRKELDLRMSTSYGPGRYETAYEEHGYDYPIGQVRWTENRNMQAFAELLRSGKLQLADLISHRFDFDQAVQAFDLIVDSEREKMGVILEYPMTDVKPVEFNSAKSEIISRIDSISLVGAGSFAANFLLPALRKHIHFDAVLTSRPYTAEHVKRQFGFSRTASSMEDLLVNSASAAVFIATRHDSHSSLSIAALKAGKRVICEKPLCITIGDFIQAKALLQSPACPDLMLGFNRRFAPHIIEMKRLFGQQPLAMNYRINAGKLPDDHWVHHPKMGGGRILGEVCHFVDLCAFLANSKVKSVSAHVFEIKPQHSDTFTATLQFENGSVANIAYFSNGNSSVGKERLEVFGGGLTAIIDDFKILEVFGKKHHVKRGKQDKGHTEEMRLVAEALKQGSPLPVSTQESLDSTLATFALQASLLAGGESVEPENYLRQWKSTAEN